MPLTHVILDDDRLTIQEAKDLIATRGDRLKYTPELFASLLATRQERDYVSTTSLTAKCLRQNSIQRQFDYTESVDGMWAAFRGTMFHGQLEKMVQEPAIEEARFFITLADGLVLSGSPDLVDPVAGILYDYKFTKENPRWNDPWKDHVEQGQINRWLVDNCDRVVWRGEEYVGDDLARFRPLDWQGIVVVYMDDKGPKPLTCTESIDVPKVGGVGTKKARVPSIWSDEVVQDLVVERYAAAHSALTLGVIPPAPAGWENQSHVLCGYCAVRSECAQLEREGK